MKTTDQKSKIILGLDPGTNLIGWGVIKKEGQNFLALRYGCIDIKSKSGAAEGLVKIYDSLSDIINKEEPDEVAIEQLFFFKNQKTVMSVAEARGVLILAAARNNRPVFEYTPLQVKQAVTGYGRADKRQVSEMIKRIFGFSKCPKPDDVTDALAVAVCHGQTDRRLIK